MGAGPSVAIDSLRRVSGACRHLGAKSVLLHMGRAPLGVALLLLHFSARV